MAKKVQKQINTRNGLVISVKKCSKCEIKQELIYTRKLRQIARQHLARKEAKRNRNSRILKINALIKISEMSIKWNWWINEEHKRWSSWEKHWKAAAGRMLK